MEVGMPRIFSPARTLSPRKRMAYAAVDPVPNPTISPSCTNFRLARAATSFSRSLAMPVTLPPSDHGINPDVQTQSGFLHFLWSACGKFSVRLLYLAFEPLLCKY